MQLHYVKQPSWFTVRLDGDPAAHNTNLYGRGRIGGRGRSKRGDETKRGPRSPLHLPSCPLSPPPFLPSFLPFFLPFLPSPQLFSLLFFPFLSFPFLFFYYIRVFAEFCGGAEVRSPQRSLPTMHDYAITRRSWQGFCLGMRCKFYTDRYNLPPLPPIPRNTTANLLESRLGKIRVERRRIFV